MINVILVIITNFECNEIFDRCLFFILMNENNSLRTKNPNPPEMIRTAKVIFIPGLFIWFSRLLLKVENPALQKADIEWKTDENILVLSCILEN